MTSHTYVQLCNVVFYRVQYSFEKVNSCFIAMGMTIVIAYLVNKPLPAAGTSEDKIVSLSEK